ncbi:SEL1-like repeat protein [Methylobacter sp. Wu8]|uniref:tetratricopeptide repeat protein n=1 Tax=Methylobacter sp. Wu8 TaxID=3118457 RepID=UPI002F349C59
MTSYPAIVATIAILLVACTEKAADSNQAKTVAPPVINITEDRIAQLQREAQAGDPDAQYNLAYLYENGLGVPKNEVKALDLYQQAADHGHSAAQNNLDAMSSVK